MLPLHDDNPVHRPSVVTWAIIVACVAAYLFWQPSPFSDDTEDLEFNLRHAAIPCEVTQGRPLTVDEVEATFRVGDDEACGVGPPAAPEFDSDKSVWLSVLVSIFLHGSLLHLGGNMLFLWVFGNNVEDRLGRVLFLLFYLTGGVVATFGHILFGPDSTVPVVGASGAIAAVMGAYLVLFPNARVRTAVIFFFITLVDIPAKWVLALWFVLQFFTDPGGDVAWLAHVVGFIFGAGIGLVVRASGLGGPPTPAVPPGRGWRRRPPPPPWDDRRFGGGGRY